MHARLPMTAVLLAALVGCGGPSSTGDPAATPPPTSPPASIAQPPAITFTERERAPLEFAAEDAVACLRAEGLVVAGPSGPPDDVAPAAQPFDPAISGPAWRQCRAEMVAYLQVAAVGPEPVDDLMVRYDCMADQGFIDPFPSPANDRDQYGQAQAFCGGMGPSNASRLTCDAFPVGADGTIGTEPIRNDLAQLITVEGTAPATSTVGTPFVVTIRPYTLLMPTSLHGVTVVDGSSFVRAFTVVGGTVDPASVRSAPPSEPDVAVSTALDGTTATFRYDGVVPATESVEFPEATFEVTPSTPGRVVVTFSGYEQSITFDVDGIPTAVRTVCTARYDTPVAWSDAS